MQITFRAAGEGTGKSVDLDAFDDAYVHLFVWHRKENSVVGAYRLGPTDEILPARGRAGSGPFPLADGSRDALLLRVT